MKTFFLAYVSLLLLASIRFSYGKNSTNKICEVIKLSARWRPLFSLKTCFMRKSITIEKSDFFFNQPKDNKITGFCLENNKRINYLPINLHENFPNLFGLDGRDCSIKQIKNENFRGLIFLKQIWLSRNEIEIIAQNTFEDLKHLEYVSLAHNKIRLINSNCFSDLPELHMVLLNFNDCIHENFDGKEDIRKMPLIFAKKCDFL